MNLLGNITAVFTITNHGVTILTDREISSDGVWFLPKGTEIELRNNEGIRKRISIRSVEYALRNHKYFLAFILSEEIKQNEVALFEEVWCEDDLEPLIE